MGYGIIIICELVCGNGLDWVLEYKIWSEVNEIVVFRIVVYMVFG